MEKGVSRDKVTEVNKAYHNRLAPEYDEREELKNLHVRNFYKAIFERRILSHFSPYQKIYCLDLGCGTGYLEQWLIPRVAAVDGIDVSPQMLHIARKKFPKVNFMEGDVYRLTTPREEYECVVSNSFLHHLKDYDTVLETMARKTKRGGVLYLGLEPNYYAYRYLAPLKNFYRKYFVEKRVQELVDRLGGEEYEHISEYHLFYGNGINPYALRKKLLALGFKKCDIIFTSVHLVGQICDRVRINFFRLLPARLFYRTGPLSRDFHLIAYK